MTAPDSSVLVAGYLPNHRFHEQAANALADVARSGCLLGHTLTETYAVLTARGGPYTVPGDTVVGYLERLLARDPIWLDGARYTRALGELQALDVDGGAIYDGLIAIAAREAGAQLVTLDRRATRTYQAVGTDFQLLA